MRRMLLCLATGTGKTFVAAQLPDALDAKRVLVLAHRDELVRQLAADFSVAGGVGIEKAEEKAHGTERVIVASTATLAVSPHRLEQLDPDTFDLVIRDEAHHAMSASEVRLWQRLGFLDGHGKKTPTPRARLVGLTATPGRSDGEVLRDLFDGIAYSLSLPDAIRDGWLVPIRAYSIETKTVLDSVTTRGGEYVADDLANTIDVDDRNAAIFDACQRHAPTSRTLIFGVTIKHAASMASFFSARGRPALSVDGTMEMPERRRILKWFAETPSAVLTNCQLIDEGTDVPGIECVANAAPTKSAIRYAQRIGRGTRLARGAHNIQESIALGKSEMILLDITDATGTTSKRAFSVHDLFEMPKRKPLHGALAHKVAEQQAAEEKEEETIREARAAETRSTLVALFGAAEQAKTILPPNAAFRWVAADGIGGLQLHLRLPDTSRLRCFEDAVGGWHVEHLDPKVAGAMWRRIMPVAAGAGAAHRAILGAEAFVRGRLPASETWLMMDGKKWQKGKASDKQVALAKKLGIPVPPGTTKGELAAAIDAHFAGRAARRK